MTDIYNVDMDTNRIQSGLGRQKAYSTGKPTVDELIVCKVLKVNYMYNTVDVVAKDKNDSYVKATETNGRYSARLPVNFGGALSNGMSYGETLPINLGDEVLIGFVRGDLNAPIVIGIYKTSSVARDLTPNPEDSSYISGDPENPENFELLFTKTTVYPSQTYETVSGLGNVEHTFAGKAFFKTSAEEQSQATVNDHRYSYEDLDNAFYRNGDLREPMGMTPPAVLFQVPWRGITDNRINVFMKDGLFRLSNVNFNANRNSMLYLNRSGDIALGYQVNDTDPDAGTIEGLETAVERSLMGIIKGIPTISTPNFLLEVRGENMVLNGRTLRDIILEYTGELEVTIEGLQDTVEAIVAIVDEIDLEELKSLQESVDSLGRQMDVLQGTMFELGVQVSRLDSSLTIFKRDITAWQGTVDTSITTLNGEIVTARGQSPKLVDRLDDADRVVAGHGTRLTSLESKVISVANGVTSSNDSLISCSWTKQGKIVVAQLTGVAKQTTVVDVPTLISGTSSPVFTTRAMNNDTGQYVLVFVELTPTTIKVSSSEEDYPAEGYDFITAITYIV